MKKSDPSIIVEQSFNTSIDDAWGALTDPDRMRQWFFGNIPDFRPEVGFETTFEVQNEGRVFPHRWKVTAVVPGQSITYTWKYDNYAGDGAVTFELFEERNSVKLRLTLNIYEDFQEDIPEFTRESCIGGWDYFLGQRLKAYLEK